MKSIFDVINENINVVNENVLDLIHKVDCLEKEVAVLSGIFKAPEQPDAHGEEGAKEVSSEQPKFDEV